MVGAAVETMVASRAATKRESWDAVRDVELIEGYWGKEVFGDGRREHGQVDVQTMP